MTASSTETLSTENDVVIGDTDASPGLLLDVEGLIGAKEYCDETGEYCIKAESLVTSNNYASPGTNSSWNTLSELAYAYHSKYDYQNVGGSNCSCKAGDLLTGCSGFQRGDRTTMAIEGGNIDYCRNEGTGQTPVYSCMGLARSPKDSVQCEVTIKLKIGSKESNDNRTVVAYENESFGIGIYAHEDDSYNMQYTEQLLSDSWGGNFFDKSERSTIGY